MEKVDVKFGKWIEQGFDLYKENIGLLILPALLVLIISMASIGILAGPMFAGLTLIVLRLLDKSDPKPAVGDVFKGFDFFVNALLFMLVYMIIGFVGTTILGIVPIIGGLLSMFFSLSLGALVLFVMFLIVDKKMDFWPAVMLSVDKVKTNFWPFLGFSIVISLISAIGLIACGIGVIVTMPYYYCAVAVAYRDVFGGEAASLVEPRMDPQDGVPPPPPLA